jgi:Holliday junction resolvase-like predicted endonuclease
MNVIKANNQKEPFSEEKVIQSIRRAHIPEPLQAETLASVKSKLYDGISTNEIYQHILEYLDTAGHPYTKTRYSLKESLMMLGPTGYPFEDFIAQLLEADGYKTQVRQVLSGKCVTHEVDVIAEKDGRASMIEAKFHNSPGVRSEVQVALYTHARFEDVKIKNKLDEAWIVTNTKTTVDANLYAECSQMKVISWDYPEGNGLREMIERAQLYPVTMLTSLTQSNKLALLNNHIVLCKQIAANHSVLDAIPLSKEDREKTIAEVTFITTNQS